MLNRYTARVAATTNFQVIGIGRNERAKIEEAITRAIGSRPGRWHVQFIGGLGEDVWEMRVSGPATETARISGPDAGPAFTRLYCGSSVPAHDLATDRAFGFRQRQHYIFFALFRCAD